MKDDLWIIEFRSPDTSHEATTAYHSREEALQAAANFIESEAQEALDGIDWSDDEAPKLLQECLKAVQEKRLDDAIVSWLEFQQEYTPEDTIAIGPSGRVSESAMDFPLQKQG